MFALQSFYPYDVMMSAELRYHSLPLAFHILAAGQLMMGLMFDLLLLLLLGKIEDDHRPADLNALLLLAAHLHVHIVFLDQRAEL